MLKDHTAEYKSKGCKLSAYGIDTKAEPGQKPAAKPKKPEAQKKSRPVKKNRPEDFRVLNRTDPDEREAYEEGYRYYSGGNAYTGDECREKGWI
jgi:hypothetical protein